MVDALVSVFVEKLVGILAEEGRTILQFHDQFEEMKRQLRLMQSFLRDADKMKRKVDTLRVIIDNLRELIYDAEDILAMCSQAQIAEQKQAMGGCLICFSPLEIPFRSQMGRHLIEINQKIRRIKEDMMSVLSPSLVIHNSAEEFSDEGKRWSSPVYDQTQIVGLEADTQKVKGWLFQESNELTTIGIVGMGGLGKTTIAKKVFNDKDVEGYFEKRMWVFVSQTIKEEEIMRGILKKLGDASIGDDQGELLRKIHHYLLEKSYLIVLDDVWNLRNGWWTRLLDGLPKASRSCVIITTRIEEVARKMGVVEGFTHRPRFLTKEESWLLFSKIAFAGSQGRCQDSKLNEVGMEIVQKCGGLPLAIKAVGGIMSCKPASLREWSRIADNFHEELAQNDNLIMASLQLSYDELPTYLKPCFLCFSIYPEDCIILKDQLIHWWIGEGIVPMKEGRSLIESGEYCFMGLMNRCLVEMVDKSYSGKVYSCKIHDMVRDLVIKIGGEESFCKLEDASFRRLSFVGDIEEKSLKSKSKMRTLISTAGMREVNKLKSIIVKMFCDCRNLRVLDLSESILEAHVEDVLCNISSLHHLRYLSLRNTHPVTKVPNSIIKLADLQILDLSFCSALKVLPPQIVTLRNLIVIDVSCCGSLKYMPKGLGKLSNLQVLKGFRPSSSRSVDGCCLGELKNLSHLKTFELLISRGDEIADNEFDVLLHLLQLQNLTISCIDGYGADLVTKLESLSLPEQLFELNLKFFPGDSTPTWLNPNSLPNLQYLSISHGNFTHFNPSFWGSGSVVWRLDGLMLESLPDMKEEWWRVHQAMPSLRLLSVSWCPKLETFPIDDVGFKGTVWMKEQGRW